MSNSETFLQTFSEVERWLRQQVNANRSASFYELVEKNARSNPAVRRYKDDLKEFADLRNAIVHERTDGHVIAEPNDRAVADFSRIIEILTNPPTIIPKFQVSVSSRHINEPIGSAVSDMRKGDFSQLPVLLDGKVVSLLTSETIMRWLASEIDNEIVSLLDTEIKNVVPHVEDEDHYCFLPRKANLLNVLDCFEDYVSRGKDLDAILITHNGKPEEQLLGIVTVYDLPLILNELGQRRISAA